MARLARTHLIVVPEEPSSLRLGIGLAHEKYSKRINKTNGWQGHLKIRKQSKSGRPIGSEAFVSSLEEKLGRKIVPLKKGPKAKD